MKMRQFVVHLRNRKGQLNEVSGQGGATVVFDPISDCECIVGVALCHEKENFWRARGVEIASGRARKYQAKCHRPQSIQEYIAVARALLVQPIMRAYGCDRELAEYVAEQFETANVIKNLV